MYLVNRLFDFPKPDVQVHLLLLQLAPLLVEQVGVVVDEVQVVARRDGHRSAPALCQPSVSLLENSSILSLFRTSSVITPQKANCSAR